MELHTQARIRAELAVIDESIADRLLPMRAVRIEDIPVDPDITARYQALLGRSFLGEQYDWLARLAKSEDVTLELSIHHDDKAHSFLETEVVCADGTYCLPESVEDEALHLFKYFSFPVFDMSKLEMQSAAQDAGFDHILEITWFCFNPLSGGEPCGYCNPCKYTREEGLSRRVPSTSPLRRARATTALMSWWLSNKMRTGLIR